jgi:monofunctional biosynthetic peptidoglycan transglycosylase
MEKRARRNKPDRTGKKDGTRRGWFSRLWRIVRWPLLAACVIIAIPLVLVPVYWVVPPVSTSMVYRQVTGQPVTRVWRDIDTTSDRLKASVIMSEDGQFCRHPGVDPRALRDEFRRLFAGETPRGASTITMQVARNLFLWHGRSYFRKALEIPLALYVDLVLPKKRIFEIYLNIAEWGPNGEFGVEAGALTAFGIDADALTWERAALLATALPNPHIRHPGRPSSHIRRVATIIERRARAGAPFVACLYDGPVPLE